jgi:hypothetical protein
VLYRRDTVTRYKSENTKTLGVRFSALLTEGGAERLEVARVWGTEQSARAAQ